MNARIWYMKRIQEIAEEMTKMAEYEQIYCIDSKCPERPCEISALEECMKRYKLDD